MLTIRVKNRALIALITAIIMSLALVLVAAIGLSRTGNVISEFESRSLPDVRVALDLSEGAAQLAALAPYIASASQPALLNQHQERISIRFEELFQTVDSISDDDFSADLLKQLSSLQVSANQLSQLVARNLFLAEALVSRQYQLKFSGYQKRLQDHLVGVFKLEDLELLMRDLSDPLGNQPELLDRLMARLQQIESADDSELIHFLQFAQENIAEQQLNNRRKQYLLVSIRVQAEYLSNAVNQFANQIQQQVVDQQHRAQVLISGVFWSMVSMMALLIVSVVTNYGANLKVLQDLTNVTHDMVRLASGDTRHTSHFAARNDEVGDLLNAYQVFRDHTQQIQQVKEDLEQQKLLLESIFNGMVDGLSVFSADNRLLAWNQQYLKVFGLTAEQVRYQMPLEQVLALLSQNGEEFRDLSGRPIDIHLWTQQRHNEAQSFERIDRAGGVIEFRSRPMANGGFITLHQDLTQRRETELQLQQAKKMEVLGQLTGGVSHDFNNFLTSILGNLELLSMQQTLDEKGLRYLKRALRATENGRELVKKLLAFSHKQILEPELIALDRLIEDTSELLEYSVAERVNLTFNLDAADAQIRVDSVQLQNALLNLTINASGAIEGEGTITIATEAVCMDGKKVVRVSVSDNGRGIPKAIQHRVFEPFFTTKAMGSGSGLGLSSVHGYVKQSGGEIGLQSELDRGTTIWMVWPVAAGPDNIVSPEWRSEPLSLGSHLLFVEDDADVAETMSDLLQKCFSQIHHFSDAESAWQWLLAHDGKVDCVLSDVHLGAPPTGVQLKQRIEAHYSGLRVYLYSGKSRESIEQQFGCLLGDNFLEKPIRAKDLQQLVSA